MSIPTRPPLTHRLRPIAEGLAGVAIDIDALDRPAFRRRDPRTGATRRASKPDNPGTGVIRLGRVHPNMHLTNVYGAVEQLRDGDVAVFSVMDSETIDALRQIHDSHGQRGEHRVNHAFDDPRMDAATFYHTFYRAALQIADSVDRLTTVVHCQAGMNRSCASIVFFAILRAFWRSGSQDTTKFLSRGDFGSGRNFRLDKLIAYIRDVNRIGRYEVLTNKTFVAMLKQARDFEFVIHQPQNARMLALREGGRIKDVARVFAWFVDKRNAHRRNRSL